MGFPSIHYMYTFAYYSQAAGAYMHESHTIISIFFILYAYLHVFERWCAYCWILLKLEDCSCVNAAIIGTIIKRSSWLRMARPIKSSVSIICCCCGFLSGDDSFVFAAMKKKRVAVIRIWLGLSKCLQFIWIINIIETRVFHLYCK